MLFFPEMAQESLEKSCVSKHFKKHVQLSHDTIEADFDELQKTLEGVPSQNIINYDKINLTDDPGRRKMIYSSGFAGILKGSSMVLKLLQV